MQKIPLLFICCLFCAGAFSQLNCDQSLWPHVYNPERLQGDKKCTTIKGIVKLVIATDDGNYRAQIKLDPGQPLALLNDKNMSLQNGCIVAEIICAHRPITNADALKTCGTYENKIKVPATGDHVQVTGFLITDADPKHGWAALYPVSDLIELQKR